MRVEATRNPFVYRWPGGAVRLEPGKPIELPDARGKRLLNKAGDKVRAITPVIYPGDRVSWQRRGTVQQGCVDFLHDDADGTTWVYCTLADRSWAAVNLRYLTHPPMSPDALAEQSEGA
jgi:hypothetical protein